MSNFTMSSTTTIKPRTILSRATQTVIYGAFEDVDNTEPVDVFIFDTPGIDDISTVFDYRVWIRKIFQHMESLRALDAAVVLLPRDRKGGAFLKGVATAEIAQEWGWKIFRNYLWEKGPDFHRAKYVFQNVYVFRQGNMPTQIQSPIRYKDIIRLPDLADTREGTVAELPVPLIRLFLSLFDTDIVVMDPFAGSGSVAVACEQLGIKKCYSIELDETRAFEIVERLKRKELF